MGSGQGERGASSDRSVSALTARRALYCSLEAGAEACVSHRARMTVKAPLTKVSKGEAEWRTRKDGPPRPVRESAFIARRR